MLEIGGANGTSTFQVTGSTPFTISQSVQIIDETNSVAAFDIASTTALTLSGTITETAGPPFTTVEKIGGGTLTYSNTASYSGATNVNAGILSVTGSITSSATTVNSGGTLKGTGTVQAVTVASGGTIAPGTSIGTLTVAGNLILDNGSITQIEISPSQSSEILSTVTGVGATVTLGGSVQVVADPGNYGTSGSNLILHSTTPYTGTFNSTVLGSLPGYTLSLTYQSNTDVLLNWVMNSNPSSLLINTTGLRGQAAKFARYLNLNAPTSSATLALANLSGSTLSNALVSASPSRNAFVPFAEQNTLFAFNNLLAGHLVDQRFYHGPKGSRPEVASLFDEQTNLLTADASGRMCLPPTCEKHSFWVGVLAEYAHQDELDENPAFHFWSGGGILGWDFYGERNLFGIGAGGAYTRITDHDAAGTAHLDYFFATLYDTVYGLGDIPLYLEFAAWGAYNQIHNERHIFFPGTDLTAKADYHSWQLVPHFGIGYHENCSFFTVNPFAQFDLAVDWQDNFQESGAGAFNMSQESHCSQFLRSEGGFRFFQTKNTCWGSWMVMEKLSYVNLKAFRTGGVSASIVGTPAFFSFETFRDTQNLGSAGLEFLWRWGQIKPVTLSIQYNGEFGSQYWTQEGMLRLTRDF